MKHLLQTKVLCALLLCAAVSSVAADTTGNWIDVPFVQQSEDGCGSAAISMILRYWAAQLGEQPSSAVDPRQIQALLFVPAQKGIPASAMRRYFEHLGYRSFAFRGDWTDLRRHISQGRPLIVSLKASGPRGPWHYSVVAGLDWERNYVFLNDPVRGKLFRISREEFFREWSLANQWTLLIVPASGA